MKKIDFWIGKEKFFKAEQLRTENAEFWRTKERLESERQQMERELKQVRAENADLKEQIMEGKQRTSSNLAQDLKLTQAELHEKTKVRSALEHFAKMGLGNF